MRPSAWILILAMALPAAARAAGGRSVLSQLWQRRILSPDKDQYGPTELLLLGRMRRAEAEDACGYLDRRFHNIRAWTVLLRDHKTRRARLVLNKEGFDKYLFLRTQDALAYFQARDVEYKTAFRLSDMAGQPLFDSGGLLTDAGQTVYDRLLARLPVYYRLPDGQVLGNRAPQKAEAPPQEERPGAQAAGALNRSRFRPVTDGPPSEQGRPAPPQAPQGPAEAPAPPDDQD